MLLLCLLAIFVPGIIVRPVVGGGRAVGPVGRRRPPHLQFNLSGFPRSPGLRQKRRTCITLVRRLRDYICDLNVILATSQYLDHTGIE